MPWQNNGDGERPNPWGNGQRGGGGRGGGNEPNIDEVIRKGQEKLKSALPGGKGGIFLILLAALVIWMVSGFYRVEPNEQGVVLRFGERTILSDPGLHWHLPYPVETVEVRGVTDEKNHVDRNPRHQLASVWQPRREPDADPGRKHR